MAVRQHGCTLAVLSGKYISAHKIGKPGRTLYECPATKEPAEKEGNAEEEDTQEKSIENAVSGRILAGVFSPCGNYFAACHDNKQLAIWRTGDVWTSLSVRQLNRRCTCLVFTQDSSTLLAGDKSGDVFSFSVTQPQQDGQLLLGHVSMLLDLALVGGDKFVVTCDRDEKLRVTCYPNTYSIHRFCLGHNDFVSKLFYLEDKDLILSGSGDGTVRTWDYRNGHQVACRDCGNDLDLPEGEYADVSCLAYCHLSHILIVAFDRRKSLLTYKITESGSLELCQNLECEGEVWDVQVGQEGMVWLLQNHPPMPLKAFTIDATQCQLTSLLEDRNDIKSVIDEINEDWSFFKDSLNVETIFLALHRAKVDNMRLYLEKKQQRIEEQNSKRKPKCPVLPSENIAVDNSSDGPKNKIMKTS